LLYRLGKRARPLIDRLIARSSLIGTGPIIDRSELPWTAEVESRWRTIRAEAEALIHGLGEIPPLGAMSPSHGGIAPDDRWRAFFLYGYGYRVEKNIARCPETAAIVERIPGLVTAFFSILSPGTRIAAHTGPTKGLVTCHLGLMIPPDGGCLMRLDGRETGWTEGQCLVFDDTYRHEVTHGGTTPRIVLLIQVKRPLRAPGRQIANLFLAGLRRSHFVQEARTNMDKWEQALSAADRPSR
jgi:beta-hydroxylase